jgi:hypothetical protein
VLSIALMALFLGPTKLLPIALDTLVLWVALNHLVPVPER